MDTMRLDKWLWAARFFKTRGLARDAIDGGKVKHNDARAKPARALKQGDWLEIQRGEDTWRVRVEALSERRGPATEAATLYHEPESSQQARAQAIEQRRLNRSVAPERRPDKRQRRLIRGFKERDLER
ncbi:MAG: S4 domain-containing protein [Wenzhouxiangellaceae bacterium]